MNVLQLEHVDVVLDGHHILTDVNFSVEPGEFVGLIGTNGAGKTTLLRTILGLLKPDHGTVTVLGRTARNGNRAIGYVPQKVTVDPDTPLRGRDMVALGLDGDRWGIPLPSRRRRGLIDGVLRDVDALAFADAPFGNLSGGEQQRLLVAQALLGEPDIILLDEPLSNLDLRSTNDVTALVARISSARNVAIVLVAHDMNPLLPFMHRIVYLANGRAVIGPVNEIVRSEVLTELYGYPVSVLEVGGRVLVVPGKDVHSNGRLVHAG
jgi:zinc/manganese transport system ATP-binding protein